MNEKKINQQKLNIIQRKKNQATKKSVEMTKQKQKKIAIENMK